MWVPIFYIDSVLRKHVYFVASKETSRCSKNCHLKMDGIDYLEKLKLILGALKKDYIMWVM